MSRDSHFLPLGEKPSKKALSKTMNIDISFIYCSVSKNSTGENQRPGAYDSGIQALTGSGSAQLVD